MISDLPALPESVSVAIDAIDWANGLETLTPLSAALIEASRACELPDLDLLCQSLPLPPDEIAEQAEARIEALYGAAIDATPIMRTFARARPAQVLGKLAELSFAAGRAGDDEWLHAIEAGDALEDAFPPREGQSVRWLDRARAALDRAFEAGRAQREIDAATAPSRALVLAKAYAAIYAAEAACPEDLSPGWVESAVARTAFRIASRHAITAAEAALVAIEAYRAEGMAVPLTVAGLALDRGKLGESERNLAEAEANERKAAVDEQMAALFADCSEVHA